MDHVIKFDTSSGVFQQEYDCVVRSVQESNRISLGSSLAREDFSGFEFGSIDLNRARARLTNYVYIIFGLSQARFTNYLFISYTSSSSNHLEHKNV